MRSIWTDEKIAELRRLKLSGHLWKDIATELCLTIHACKNRWMVITQGEAKRIKRLEEKRRRRIRNQGLKINRAEGMEPIPAEVWTDRNLRLSQPLTITAFVFGDPPPSRSALAQREVRA